MKVHALLSPSSASRWLVCTPSARLESILPDRAGAAADEGTLAHSVGELILRFKLGEITKQKYSVELKKLQKNPLYNENLHSHAEDYSVFVLERYTAAQNRTKDALIFLERKLDMTEWIPEGFGTGDCIIIADGVLEIIDLKYGKGVLVSAIENKQMMTYALGALNSFGFLYDVVSVRMTIFQPRLDNYSTFEITVDDLLQWAKTCLKPRALLAYNGEGEFIPGPHCQFCKAKAQCRTLADYNLQLAKYDFKKPELLKDHEISEILERAANFKSWVSSVEEFARAEAIENGKKWPGFKLVEGRSNRTYSDDEKVAAILIENGYKEEEIFTKNLIGITAMEKLLSKNVFADLITPFIVKPPGKPTLVPESDKRPEWNSAEAAAKDFAGIEN